ncbi:MAG: DUF4124 domain-containing protein [Gammaproteobacteria bacterium]|nr:DUF4124 domain-containing protein [Gammaproteobacteria bacterium]
MTTRAYYYFLAMQLKPPFFIAILCLLAAFSPQNQAQMYRWVDETGKTHFSDKPPSGARTKFDTLGSSEKSSAPAKQTSPGSEQLKNLFSTSKLVITSVETPWDEKSEKKTTIGRYFFGKACASATAMVMPDALERHPSLIPNATFYGAEIANFFRVINFSAFWDDSVDAADPTDWPQTLRVEAGVEEVEFDTCAPSERRAFRNFKLDNVRAERFSRHRVRVKVAWTIRSDDGEVLLQTETSGEEDGWNKRNRASTAHSEAIRASIVRLVEDAQFQTVLADARERRIANTASDKTDSTQGAATSFGNELWSKFKNKSNEYISYFRQAQLSKALQLIPSIKVRLTEYYMNSGHWPGHLTEIQFDEHVFVEQTEGLERIYLESRGSIVLKLDEKFGGAAHMVLQPSVDNRNSTVFWRCLTNISKDIVPEAMNCDRKNPTDKSGQKKTSNATMPNPR